MRGYSLAPLISGTIASVHPFTAPLGYELSGNAVLFKGDWKLVKNLPPYGDARWHLYNITPDPGETSDQAAAEPARFAAMQADYAAYAKAEQVLPMPEGYSAPGQIEANALRTLLIPRLLALWPYVLGVVALLGALITWRRRKRVKAA